MNEFISLDDDDAILLEREILKVSRLKHLINEEIKTKLSHYVYDQKKEQRAHYTVKTSLIGVAIVGEYISFTDIQFNSVKDCQILKVGGNGWQKGKLKINISIAPKGNNPNPVSLEFYPDVPIELKTVAQQSPPITKLSHFKIPSF